MPDALPELEVSATHITDLVAFFGLALRALRLQGVPSPQRNTQIRLVQTMQRRFLSQLEGQSTHLVVALSDEEVATLKALLREITPLLEQQSPSFEKERRSRSLAELQQVFAHLSR